VSALRDAYELIKDPERWTRGCFARTEAGTAVVPWDRTAAAWCAHGALLRVACEDATPVVDAARTLFPADMADDVLPLVRINDELGHEAVMQVFEKAIVEEEGSL